MIRTALFAALFATAGAAFAAPVSYNIDPTHTYASYEVNHLGLSVQAGTFTKISGKLTVDEAAKSGAVDVSIDAASLQTFLGDRDKHLDVTLSVHLTPQPGGGAPLVTLTTVVCTHNLLGRAYMLPVTPMHRIIAPAVLRAVARP